MSPIFPQLFQKATTCGDRKACLEVHGVRITPPFIHFKHAFEGRTYRQNLTIQNVGKSKVVVKITKPTSLAFGIKEVKGYSLSPGLCLAKEVSYVYTYANVPYCILPIYVNDKRIDFEVVAEESSPEISFEPRSLNFGLVEINCASALRLVTIRNDGSQPARFFIDTVSPSGHKYMADPNKGYIQPKSSVTVHIKVTSSIPGRIHENLWLKCEKPYKISVTAEIICPCFEPIHDLTAKSFTIIEFPPTYVGVSSSQTVYIRNYSANAIMFCLRGETEGQITCLKKIERLDEDYNYFQIYPKDGVWESKEVKVFRCFFKPVKPSPNKPLKHSYFCIYHISRIRCRYLHESMYGGYSHVSSSSMTLDRLEVLKIYMIASRQKSARLAQTSVLLGSIASSIPEESKPIQKCLTIKLYAHAVAEEPSVTVIPDEIRIPDVVERQREVRVLRFRNNSKRLPIVIGYQKATFVDVDQPNFTIEPNKSVEISVLISPRKVGRYSTTLQFHLKYYDEPRIKRELKVIGKVSVLLDVDVKAAKKVNLPKIEASNRIRCVNEVKKFPEDKISKRSLIGIQNSLSKRNKCDLAFPQDSPWKCSKMKTTSRDFFRCVQRIDSDCGLTVFGEKMKLDKDSYYNNHVKKVTKQLQLTSEFNRGDYELTDVKHLLCEDISLQPCLQLKKKTLEQPYSEVIPLSPAELSNIFIDPLAIYTQRIAVHSEYSFELTIRNCNNLPIRIYVRPEKSNVIFPKGNRLVISQNSVAYLPVTYASSTSGYYTASLNVIVNECSVFVVNIMADVLAVYLNVSTDTVEFTDDNTRFVEISNPLNADVVFRWSLDCENFLIDPVEGVVKGYSKLACQVTYLPNQEGPSTVDAELLAFDVVTQQVKLSVMDTKPRLKFAPQELAFDDIPLNMPVLRKVLLRNETMHAREYSLVQDDFLKYADVDPVDGMVHGTYNAVLPIYLKSDMATDPHNTLCIEGVFKLPGITINNVDIYQKPGPLLVSNTASIRLYLDNHLENCRLWVSQEIRGWNTELIEEKSEEFNKRTVLMNIMFTTDQIGVFETQHSVNCTCGVTRTVTLIGCRENCFLTNYAQVHTFIANEEYNLQLRKIEDKCIRQTSLVSVLDNMRPLKEIYESEKFFTEYPFFPEQETELKEFLEPVVEAVENWMHSQGFFGDTFYSIPRGLAFVMFDNPVVIPPFIQLLLNITEDGLKDYFELRHPGEDRIEQTKYLYELYEKALDFLQSIGALLTYVRPEILLGYTPYKIFKENFDCGDRGGFDVTITNRDEFYRLSKQYWLDILLQTFKVLVLKHLFFVESGIYKAPRRSFAYERYSSSIKRIAQNKHLFSNTELLLLNWFQFHYNDIRQTFWLDNSYLEEREITYFGENMNDGFVYAAVTIAYCPYLASHFENMCRTPLQPEEILHNNITVIQSWHMLNFSIKVTVEDIAIPNPLKTLMLMTYLYQMLPNMHPSETLLFTADLSQHSQKTLVVKNVNRFPIAYKTILYGKDSECFKVDEFYVIPPKKKCRIVIDYWAKFIRQAHCTLILSGECVGYHYAKSNVISLVGNPNVSFMVEEIEVEGKLYEVVAKSLKVTSPYSCAAMYHIQFTLEPLSDIDKINSLSYEMPPNSACRFLLNVRRASFGAETLGLLEAYITCLTRDVIPVWIFFRNPEVGDFAIKVVTSCSMENPVREILYVSVPKLDSTEQLGKDKFRAVTLRIPARNEKVWSTMAEVFTKSTGDEEEFWSVYAHTSVGIHVLQKILLEYIPSYHYKLCDHVRYKTKASKNCGIMFPKYIDIEEECSLGMVDVPIKVLCTLKFPKTIDLELVSLDGVQYRYCSIVLTRENE
ncbi:hypothetical protein Trydic_g15778 [Trypoxylus dichotomus]